MPCGGIYPVKVEYGSKCWYNDGDDAELFCDEWDTFIHIRCLGRFLESIEGRCMLSHGHAIFVPEGYNDPKIRVD
jgi:hypothetical protein